jgi:hypothetical protein
MVSCKDQNKKWTEQQLSLILMETCFWSGFELVFGFGLKLIQICSNNSVWHGGQLLRAFAKFHISVWHGGQLLRAFAKFHITGKQPWHRDEGSEIAHKQIHSPSRCSETSHRHWAHMKPRGSHTSCRWCMTLEVNKAPWHLLYTKLMGQTHGHCYTSFYLKQKSIFKCGSSFWSCSHVSKTLEQWSSLPHTSRHT